MDATEPLCAWRHGCNGCRMNVERSDDGLQRISSNVEQSDGQLWAINRHSERLECRSLAISTSPTVRPIASEMTLIKAPWPLANMFIITLLYSVLILSTGLVLTALMIWKPTERMATNRAKAQVAAKIQGESVMR